MMCEANTRASRSSVGKNSTVQSQSVSSCQYGSKSSLLVRSQDRHISQFSGFPCQHSRYKDGTTWACSLAFSSVPYTALQSDRCLFHGGNTGSNPVELRQRGVNFTLPQKDLGRALDGCPLIVGDHMRIALEHPEISMTELLLYHAWVCAHPHQLRTQAVPESMEPTARDPQVFADRVQNVPTAPIATGWSEPGLAMVLFRLLRRKVARVNGKPEELADLGGLQVAIELRIYSLAADIKLWFWTTRWPRRLLPRLADLRVQGGVNVLAKYRRLTEVAGILSLDYGSVYHDRLLDAL